MSCLICGPEGRANSFLWKGINGLRKHCLTDTSYQEINVLVVCFRTWNISKSCPVADPSILFEGSGAILKKESLKSCNLGAVCVANVR